MTGSPPSKSASSEQPNAPAVEVAAAIPQTPSPLSETELPPTAPGKNPPPAKKGRSHKGSDQVSSLSDQISQLHTIFAVSTENGLFPKGDSGDAHYASLKKSLADASSFASEDPPNEESALSSLHDFYRELNQAQSEAGLVWRLSNLYAIPGWIYLVVSPLFIYFAFVWWHPFPYSNLLQASFWGLLGGCLQGFYWIYQQVSREQFRATWAFWILALPPGGLIFGGVAYLLITGGVLSLLTTSPPAVNQYSAFLFSALAGFSWKDFAALVKRFWDRLSPSSKSGAG